MVRKNISLYPLRFFEAAARHTSFAGAANELCVTPAAVAHQVKQLERHLGVDLFDRLPRGVALNAKGQDFLKYVQQALDTLQQGCEQVGKHARRPAIKVVVLHAFMEKWLLPRMQAFRALYPDIGIELRTTEKPVNLQQDQVHVWISNSDSPPCGERSELLFTMRMAPVCSPQMAAACSHADLLAQAPYLYDVFWEDDWPTWLRQYAPHLRYDTGKAMGFDLYSMVVQAAVGGMGLAIGYDALVQQEIAEGSLVFPFEQFCTCPKHFYLNLHANDVSEEVNVFAAWLRIEAQTQRQMHPNATAQP